MRLAKGIEGMLLLACLLLAFFANGAAADEHSDRRRLMGLKILPAMVAADLDLSDKLTKDGRVRLVLVYRFGAEVAEKASQRLIREIPARRIKNYPMRVETLPYSQLSELSADPPAAIMVVEPAPPDELAKAVRFGIEHHRIVFSPFQGDVSAGASAGVFIGDRTLPLVNPETLNAAGIRLKPFLLEIARTHE